MTSYAVPYDFLNEKIKLLYVDVQMVEIAYSKTSFSMLPEKKFSSGDPKDLFYIWYYSIL